MHEKVYGFVVHNGYHGVRVQVVAPCGKIKHKDIHEYPKNPDGAFAVKVDGKWYACMPGENGRILIEADKNKKLEFDGQVFRLCDHGGTCTVPCVVREAESDGYLVSWEDGMFVFDPVLYPRKQKLEIYPKNPESHFVLPFEGSDHVFIKNGATHFVVKVHTIPDTFEYNEKTYTVSRHGSSTMVSDGDETFMCVLENGECHVRLVKN